MCIRDAEDHEESVPLVSGANKLGKSSIRYRRMRPSQNWSGTPERTASISQRRNVILTMMLKGQIMVRLKNVGYV